ncbi:MAG TPA: Maf-like protein [Beijerinckiaceae bacterium]|mgnify:CR=1 FL=1|nr:Maf-like protein [Beijerinckiaceae bacterium]
MTAVTDGWRPRLALASASPRRFALLQQIGVVPDAVVPAAIDETPQRGEKPRALVTRLSREKAKAALKVVRSDPALAGAFLVAADTSVSVGSRILPQTHTVDEAAHCLRLLSGRSHRVYTSVVVVTPGDAFRQRIAEARVRFKRLSESEIEAYLGSGEWRGKAGGYAIQGLAGAFVVKLVGSYSAVVGLPLYETAGLLVGDGFPLHFSWANSV